MFVIMTVMRTNLQTVFRFSFEINKMALPLNIVRKGDVGNVVEQGTQPNEDTFSS
jgi:hypothetical protein